MAESFPAISALIDSRAINRMRQVPANGITLDRGKGVATAKGRHFTDLVYYDVRNRNRFEQVSCARRVRLHRREYGLPARAQVAQVPLGRGDDRVRRRVGTNPSRSFVPSSPGSALIEEVLHCCP